MVQVVPKARHLAGSKSQCARGIEGIEAEAFELVE
jgi:hypothetical protein